MILAISFSVLGNSELPATQFRYGLFVLRYYVGSLLHHLSFGRWTGEVCIE